MQKIREKKSDDDNKASSSKAGQMKILFNQKPATEKGQGLQGRIEGKVEKNLQIEKNIIPPNGNPTTQRLIIEKTINTGYNKLEKATLTSVSNSATAVTPLIVATASTTTIPTNTAMTMTTTTATTTRATFTSIYFPTSSTSTSSNKKQKDIYSQPQPFSSFSPLALQVASRLLEPMVSYSPSDSTPLDIVSPLSSLFVSDQFRDVCCMVCEQIASIVRLRVGAGIYADQAHLHCAFECKETVCSETNAIQNDTRITLFQQRSVQFRISRTNGTTGKKNMMTQMLERIGAVPSMGV